MLAPPFTGPAELPQVLKERLGLFPVPLYTGGTVDQAHQFILYNGTRGNFCLDLEGSFNSESNRSVAWSANVGHYIALISEAQEAYFELQRWDSSTFERYSFKSVIRSLDKFYQYLEDSTPPSDLSVVAHVTRVFRMFRTTLGREHNGQAALKGFLLLLASTADNVSRDEVDLDRWSIDQSAIDVADAIVDEDWIELRHQLLRGRSSSGLEAKPNLILRHAAGQVFQEAHYIAIFENPEQLRLPGITPAAADIDSAIPKTGLHFTPPALARTLVEEAILEVDLSQDRVTIFDPACGSGEFLREAVRQLVMQGYTGEIRLIGWDISPAARDMSAFSVGWEVRGIEDRVTIDLRIVDSLTEEWPDVDVIIMNPPFGSWNFMTDQQRESVKDILGSASHGKVDLAHAFIYRAAETVGSKGVLAAVIPASLFDSRSARKLREQVAEKLQATLIARLGSHHLFPGVTVDTGLYVGVREEQTREDSTLAFWADHKLSSNSAALRELRRIRHAASRTDELAIGEGYSIYPNPDLTSSSDWAPRPYKAWRIAHFLKSFPTVGDSFNVRQGAHTGKNKAFVISSEQFDRLPIEEKEYFRPAVTNESIRNGLLAKRNYAFYPHGRNEIVDEDALFESVPVFAEQYLLPYRDYLQNRARVPSNKWWNYSEPRSWLQIRTPKLVTTYFGRSGAFAWDKTGEFVVIQGYAWLPKKGKHLSTSLAHAYLAILNSPFFEELLSGYSNLMSGGQWNFSKRYVKDVPLPDLFGSYSSPDVITCLEEIGETISADGLSALRLNDDEYYALVAAVYGVTEEVA